MLNGIFKRKRRGERGLQMAEMAVVMPVMMVLLGGLAEFSYYFYTYSSLARATRAGAGYIYTKAFISAETDKAKNLVLCGEVASCSGQSPIVKGLTAANVEVSLSPAAAERQITVRIINYSYTPLFNLQALTGLFGKTADKQATWNTTVTKVNAATTMRYVGDR